MLLSKYTSLIFKYYRKMHSYVLLHVSLEENLQNLSWA